jgi:hypothetical protein
VRFNIIYKTENNEREKLKDPFLPMRIEENFILTTRGSPAPVNRTYSVMLNKCKVDGQSGKHDYSRRDTG